MATIGTFKKTGNEYTGEIVTLSVQAEGVRIVTPAPIEQLQLARAYLEAREVHANDPAMDRVFERIVEERYGEDLRHSLSHGEKGITQG